MTRVANNYVIDKMESGIKLTMVNFNTCKIRDCGSMTMDELLACIKDAKMCFFFSSDDET